MTHLEPLSLNHSVSPRQNCSVAGYSELFGGQIRTAKKKSSAYDSVKRKGGEMETEKKKKKKKERK